MVQTVVFVLATGNVTAPPDYSSTNTIVAIGSGAGDTFSSAPGGAGASADISNNTDPPGTVWACVVGTHDGTTKTQFKNSSTLVADFGRKSPGFKTAGVGGAVANCVGTNKFKGGDGGAFVTGSGLGGGGGAGGPSGAGGNGGAGNGTGTNTSGGGGGANNGSAGQQGQATTGGNGGNGNGGTGGGAGGLFGGGAATASSGGGSGGAGPTGGNNGASSHDTYWDASHGCGGGSGGTNSGTAGNGGIYGGAGGAGGSGNGADGIIVISYTPAVTNFNDPLWFSMNA